MDIKFWEPLDVHPEELLASTSLRQSTRSSTLFCENPKSGHLALSCLDMTALQIKEFIVLHIWACSINESINVFRRTASLPLSVVKTVLWRFPPLLCSCCRGDDQFVDKSSLRSSSSSCISNCAYNATMISTSMTLSMRNSFTHIHAVR
jgi:hypothetical protein